MKLTTAAFLVLLLPIEVPGQAPVIDNKAPLWKSGQEWRVAAKPSVDIGQVEGEPAYELAGVSGVVRLDDGRVAVALMSSSEIRFYDRTGKHLKTVGRKGAGPGEFQQLMSLRRMRGDTLLGDDRGERVEVFSPTGEFIRDHRLSSGVRRLGVFGRFDDGSFVGGNPILNEGATRTGLWVDSTEFAIYDASGQKLKVVGSFAFTTMAREPSIRYSQPITFGPRMSVTGAGDRFYYNFTDDYVIDVYDREGKLIRRIKRAWTPRPVTKEDIGRYHDSFVNSPDESGGTSAEWKAFRERRFRETKFADQFPAHGGMRVDRAGNLWVQETMRPSGRPMPSRFYDLGKDQLEWSVFNPDGRWLGQVTTPGGFVVMEIGADYIAGLWRDELDVEHVRIYPLVKPRES